jgi:sec-independent protein translocase protein TatC
VGGKPDREMSVLEHIAELRTTIAWALAFAVVATVVAWFFSDAIVNTLLDPAIEAGQEALFFSAPMEAFMLKMKASTVIGLFAVLPLILYKLYAFVLPGLKPGERRIVTPMLVATTVLFYIGVAFCFFILMPMIIRFAIGFATPRLRPWLTADAYFALASRLCLAFGLLFELPMVVFALSWAGVVKPRTLLRTWRYALVIILVVSAVLTPPDVISQVMLAGPVMLLYLGSVLVAMVVRRKREATGETLPEERPPDSESD